MAYPSSSTGYSYAFSYQNDSPVQTADQDTGVAAATLPSNTIVISTILFTVTSTGNQYAIAVQSDNNLSMMATGNIRQLRSAEPVSGGGDVAFGVWLDDVTGTYHYSLDVDGGGKTLDSVILIARSLS